jgi:hypothetical protein
MDFHAVMTANGTRSHYMGKNRIPCCFSSFTITTLCCCTDAFVHEDLFRCVFVLLSPRAPLRFGNAASCLVLSQIRSPEISGTRFHSIYETKPSGTSQLLRSNSAVSCTADESLSSANWPTRARSSITSFGIWRRHRQNCFGTASKSVASIARAMPYRRTMFLKDNRAYT